MKNIYNYAIYLWWVRNFKVISNRKANNLKLKHLRNVYGDEINYINCRSIWIDNKKREYRVIHLLGIDDIREMKLKQLCI